MDGCGADERGAFRPRPAGRSGNAAEEVLDRCRDGRGLVVVGFWTVIVLAYSTRTEVRAGTFEWVPITWIDALKAAAAQVLTMHDHIGHTVTLDFDDDDAATGVDGQEGVVVGIEDGKFIVDVDGFQVKAAQHETTLVEEDR